MKNKREFFMIRINLFKVNKLILFIYISVLVPLFFSIIFVQVEHWTTITIPSSTFGLISDKREVDVIINTDSISSSPLIFVGDVLLARNVEYLMQIKSHEYPFTNLPDLFGSYNSAVIGNFESAILEKHIKTPSYITTFSVDKKFLPALKKSGFTHMSLANNHSFDYGSSTFNHTRQSLYQAGIEHFGHPYQIDAVATLIIKTGSTRVGVVALNQIFYNSNLDEVATVLATLASSTDYQIIYVHWGEEYMLKHNTKQEILARKLIDFGADAILGHHPHVVQDIDMYKNKPIFYSLGNFIFDQYFSVDVKQGLLLKLSFINKMVHFELVPVSSESQNSQPARMREDANILFLTNLARRSNPILSENIKSGKLILPFSLATYE